MSGGSWNYRFIDIRYFAKFMEEGVETPDGTKLELTNEQKSARKKFARLLEKVADTMQIVEYVDSSDMSTPNDIEAIDNLLENL
jgi:hypothetical protein